MNGIDPKAFLEEEDIQLIYNNSYPFLQKYVEGINMTRIGSDSINKSMLESDKFYLVTNEDDVSLIRK